MEEALYLTRFASKVHLFHRREELRATGVLRELIMAAPKWTFTGSLNRPALPPMLKARWEPCAILISGAASKRACR